MAAMKEASLDTQWAARSERRLERSWGYTLAVQLVDLLDLLTVRMWAGSKVDLWVDLTVDSLVAL